MKSSIALLIASASLIAPAIAAPERLNVRGHVVEITEADGAFQKLLVDGKELLEDHRIDPGEVRTVDGVAVMVGFRHPGGNRCGGSHYIVSFPADRPVRIDHPGDSCLVEETTVSIDTHDIRIETPSSPQNAGSRWTWTPANGLGPETSVAFSPRVDDGWAALRAQSVDHPSRLFHYADLARLIDARVGPLRAAALRNSTGPGNVGYANNLVVATSCQSHACDETDLLIVADMASRTLYVALKAARSAPLISPRPATWSRGAKSHLLAFEKRWLR